MRTLSACVGMVPLQVSHSCYRHARIHAESLPVPSAVGSHAATEACVDQGASGDCKCCAGQEAAAKSRAPAHASGEPSSVTLRVAN